jgi:hypothetical protein
VSDTQPKFLDAFLGQALAGADGANPVAAAPQPLIPGKVLVRAHQSPSWPVVQCPVCKHFFHQNPKEAKRGGGRCCSPVCGNRFGVRQKPQGKVALYSPRWLQKLYSELYKSAKKGSKKRNKRDGIPFLLTKAEFELLIKRAAHRCEITGRPFEETKVDKKHGRHPLRPSLDRIDANGPYSFDNCRLVLVSVNQGLGTWGETVYQDNAMALIARTHLITPIAGSSAPTRVASAAPSPEMPASPALEPSEREAAHLAGWQECAALQTRFFNEIETLLNIPQKGDSIRFRRRQQAILQALRSSRPPDLVAPEPSNPQ